MAAPFEQIYEAPTPAGCVQTQSFLARFKAQPAFSEISVNKSDTSFPVPERPDDQDSGACETPAGALVKCSKQIGKKVCGNSVYWMERKASSGALPVCLDVITALEADAAAIMSSLPEPDEL